MVAVVGVGLSTAVFGLLPSVAQIGWSAAFLFLAFRLVQGIFVGGVVASSHTIGTESVPERWRGLMSGAVGGGAAGFVFGRGLERSAACSSPWCSTWSPSSPPATPSRNGAGG